MPYVSYCHPLCVMFQNRPQMNSIFKIYSKDKTSNQSDSIFSIIGRTEPDLTKSLAFLLHYSFSDSNAIKNKIGVTLTKDKLYFSQDKLHNLTKIVSLKWQDIIYILSHLNEQLITSFKKEIMKSNFIKTYEEEVFCPPVGGTYSLVEELNIYCCPADRSLKDAIYLMPRIPIAKSDIKKILTDKYGITDFASLKGKGCSIALYKIDSSFIVDNDSIEAIEDQTIKDKVKRWIGNEQMRLKVFILSEKMEFERPKITDVQNNAWNGYFKLSQVWGDLISKNTNA